MSGIAIMVAFRGGGEAYPLRASGASHLYVVLPQL